MPTVLWAGVLAAIIAVWWRTYGAFQLGTYLDDAKYVILARALAAGETFRLHVGPSPPIATDYPFVFPLLLAPFVRWWPDAFDRMTAVSLIATLVNVAVIYWAWPRLSASRSRWWAVAVSASYGLAPLTLGHVGMVMSEPVFTTWVLGALVLAERIAQRRDASPVPYTLLGAFCTLAVFTRLIGLALVAAVVWRVIGVAWRRWSCTAAFLGGGLAVVVPALWLSSLALEDLLPERYLRIAGRPSSGVYEPAEDDVVTRVTRGISMYATAGVREVLLPVGGGLRERAMWEGLGLPDLTPLTGIAITALVLLGIVAAPAQGRVRPAVRWFELLTLAVLFIWPYRTRRFLYPLLPFLSFQLLQGAWTLTRVVAARVDRARGPRIAAAAVMAFVGLTTVQAYRFASRAESASTYFAPDYRAATRWLREESPADAVVMAEEWGPAAIFAQRPLVPTVGLNSVDALAAALRQYGVTHVVLLPVRAWRSDGQREYSPYAREVFVPFINRLHQRGALTLVHQADQPEPVRVYRVDPAAGF